MIQPLDISVGTVVVLVVVAAWVIWAVRRLFFRGMCDCHDQCSATSSDDVGRRRVSCGGCSGCSGCAGCSIGAVNTVNTTDASQR
ncbi:hypothetical protein [Adlercreutzia sp. ZJ141]|uniref:hypothetical protein n=1 Tax=Adlercreutzia sp. ZJ141 TaxID=2709406 RepID=UPI0013EB3704|nr:hypothetical protein [Adlercreutzia sp. ZJ141]